MPLPKAAPAAAPTVDLATSDKLSIVRQGQPPMKGRKVGVLFAEGSDKAALDKLKAAIEGAGGTAFFVAPKVGELKLKGGALKADGQLAGSPSFLFDAVACAIMPDQAKLLAKDGAALQWFMDAYGHCKTIGYCPATKEFILDKLDIELDAGVIPNAEFAAVAPARHWEREPKVRMLA
jgi:catalase